MNGPAYYNEHDPRKAAWLRELMRAGAIAPGDVDERSIRDVRGADLAGYRQCHFFAGIGVWSYALRCAGWPDDRPVWTGSCPCQPFSAAGKRQAQADDRHLWPDLFRLIQERQPECFLGEQVASKDGLAWLDLVLADLECADYAAGAIDLCAAGVGAPHIRQRLWIMAHNHSERRYGQPVCLQPGQPGQEGFEAAGRGGAGFGLAAAAGQRHDGRWSGETCGGAQQSERPRPVGQLADAMRGGAPSRPWPPALLENPEGAQRRLRAEPADRGQLGNAHAAELEGRRDNAGEYAGQRPAGAAGLAGGLADADGRIAGHGELQRGRQYRCQPQDGGADRLVECAAPTGTGATDGIWRDPDWLRCRDGRWRPVEPGTFPLAHGSPARVGRLRGYGDAIVAPLAEEFIRSVMEMAP